MKALTYWRPWPTLILSHGKDCENRTQPPPRDLIGERVAVHAGKRYGIGEWPFEGAPPADADCPLGIVGTVRIAGVLDRRGREPIVWTPRQGRIARSAPLAELLDIEEVPLLARLLKLDQSPWWAGPVGILIEDPIALSRPIAISGSQGWWPVPADVAAQVVEQEAEVRRAA